MVELQSVLGTQCVGLGEP